MTGDSDIRQGVARTAQILLVLAAVLALYIVYLQVIKADDLVGDPLNRRRGQVEIGAVRGSIFAADGAILAYSDESGRHCPMGEDAAFVTGYATQNLGSTGLEHFANAALTGDNTDIAKLGPIDKLLRNFRGNDIWLTIDSRVQRAAYRALADKRGAAVVIDAQSGAVLALVSTPAFDPNTVEEDWQALNSDDARPLLNRATMGLYPPGSIIKPLIADAALATGETNDNEVFVCSGELDVGGGYHIGESHGEVHGRQKLADAIANSCNVTFGTLAMRMGEKKLLQAFGRFGLDKTGEGELTWSAAHLPPKNDPLDDGDVAQLGIGQSYLLATPMSMALTAAAFANGGKVMRPYLIERIASEDGDVSFGAIDKLYYEATDSARAEKINEYMKGVVEHGTGKAAQIKGISVAGKTGTAENPGGEDHAWFIGSADIGTRRVAFAVLVENGGSGAVAAAPIAREILTTLAQESGGKS